MYIQPPPPLPTAAAFRRMALSISVAPFSSIDLSVRHVSTTWPGHHGCDPDVRGRRGRSVHPSQIHGGDTERRRGGSGPTVTVVQINAAKQFS